MSNRLLIASKRARTAVQASPPKQMMAKTFAAPVGGWVTVDSLLQARPNSALVMENWFPLQSTLRARGGSRIWATLSAPITSMLTYNVKEGSKLFAATADHLYDLSFSYDVFLLDENGDPLLDEDDEVLTIGDPAPDAVVGDCGGYYCYVNFSTAGGFFMVAVNGANPLLIYDGTDFYKVTDVSSGFMITGVATSLLSHVAAYRNRLFFVQRDSLSIWYLSVNAIAGELSEFPLAGVFKRGGSLLFAGTWSMDAGDGLDDKFVIVSTLGEVAVYEGSNPSSADDWSLVGNYEMARPLGPRAVMRVGGDLLIATEDGLVPISAVIGKDIAALSLAAVSRNIENVWLQQAINRAAFPWEVVKWPRKNMAVVSLPTSSTRVEDQYCFVVNIETGAWTKYTNWDTRCLELFEDWLYFGTSKGLVLAGEIGGMDVGDPYSPTVVWNWDAFDALGMYKTVIQARGKFLTATPINPQISVSTDYTVSLPDAPDAPTIGDVSTWDNGQWDVALWDQSVTLAPFDTRWGSIGLSGEAIAPQLQITSDSIVKPTAELIEATFTHEMGGLVV